MDELLKHLSYAGTGMGVGLFAWFGAWLIVRRTRGKLRMVAVPLGLIGLGGMVGGFGIVGFFLRPLPEPTQQTLFPGATYRREVLHNPPVILHWAEVDLAQPGLQVSVTPSEPTGAHQVPARTTSAYAEAFDVQLAINAAFFFPWHSNTLLDYYPHAGDPVTGVGMTMAHGKPHDIQHPDPRSTTLWALPDGRVEIGTATRAATFAVSGYPLLTRGQPAKPLNHMFATQRHPRTAAGVNATGRKLVLLVVDGRQPYYSEGMGLDELARHMRRRGVHDAVLFDGGGSTTMVARIDGQTEVLNVPVHGRIPPGLERPVATHLGIQAR